MPHGSRQNRPFFRVFLWLVGTLMIILTVLAFLKGRHKLGERTAVLIIVAVLLGTMIALAVGQF